MKFSSKIIKKQQNSTDKTKSNSKQKQPFLCSLLPGCRFEISWTCQKQPARSPDSQAHDASPGSTDRWIQIWSVHQLCSGISNISPSGWWKTMPFESFNNCLKIQGNCEKGKKMNFQIKSVMWQQAQYERFTCRGYLGKI